MKRWLVFGLRGQVGAAFGEALAAGEAALVAVSRRPPLDAPGLCWIRGELGPDLRVGEGFDAVISLGPLDHFSHWFEQAGLAPARVVALGSTSVHSKATSPDPAERELAARLAVAEVRLATACASRRCALALLRPTLTYGGGERNLSRIVGLARRWRWLPLPNDATGLRQPVHAGDVAAAVLASLRSSAPVDGRYDLPGGETLAYDEMLRRVLAVATPRACILRLPTPLFRLGIRLARPFGLAGAGEGLLSRLERDLVFDAGPARRDLGYEPRPFQPRADMFRGDAAPQQPGP